MARKPKVQAEGAAAAQQPLTVQLQLVVNTSEDTPTYYANYAEASYAPHEIALVFTRVPTKLPPDMLEKAKAGAMEADALVQVLIAPTLLNLFIEALTTTKANYEKTFGPIKELSHASK